MSAFRPLVRPQPTIFMHGKTVGYGATSRDLFHALIAPPPTLLTTDPPPLPTIHFLFYTP
ncbi:MAG TPA: hypothetical protein VHO48_14320 [Anaerolineaceae bacterium]|nr:hypothetical protein [Anaerolineaceae bacterium]